MTHPTNSRPTPSSTLLPVAARLARRTLVATAAVSALWLGGCASNVKLDDGVVRAPILDSSINKPGGGAGGAGGGAASAVAPVVNAGGDASQMDASLARVIYFDFDSFVVREDALPAVQAHAKALTGAKGKKITLEGHTDDRGGREYNLALGQKRAEATAKALGLLGVSAEQVEAVSFGKERPAAEGQTEEAWAKNRRVEFKAR